MPGEYLSNQPEPAQEGGELQKRLRIIEEIRSETKTIARAVNEYRPHEGGREDMLDYILSGSRLLHLENLSEKVLAVAEYEMFDGPINLTDGRLAQRILEDIRRGAPEFLRKDTYSETTEAVTQGQVMAIDDFLEIVAPDHIISAYARHIHFFPWRQDLLYLAGIEACPAGNGILEVRRQTKLPNIEIVDFYLDTNTDKPKPPSRTFRLVK